MSARGRRAGGRAPGGERRPRANREGGGGPKLPPRGSASPAGREPGPAERRPRTRAPAAPGQRPRTSSSGGGGVGGGAREANRSSGAARRPPGSSAQVRGERGAGRRRASRTEAARSASASRSRRISPADAWVPGPAPVPGGSSDRGPPPPRARFGGPAPPPPAPDGAAPRPPPSRLPAPALGPRFLRHWPRRWVIPPGSSCKGAGPGRRWSLPPIEASAINRAPRTAKAQMPRQATPRLVVGEGSGSQGASGAAATMLRSLLLHSLRLCAQTASCLVLFPRFLGTAFMLWLLDFLCIRKHFLGRRRRDQPEPAVELDSDGEEVPPDDPPVCVSDDNRLCTLASLKAVWHGQKLDFFKQAYEGGPAPNSEVVLPHGFQNQHILDYARGNRPLVLNFGSCT